MIPERRAKKPMSIGIGILCFLALMLLAVRAKRHEQLTASTVLGLCAYAALAWGIIAEWLLK
jgi:hypothetical protein